VSKDKPKNLVASVHNRLVKIAQEQREEFHFVLTRYVLERLLYRLSQSPHRDSFVLKGAMLFALWSGQRLRPTKDLDLLGRGDNSVERCEQLFRDICAQPVEEDGLTFLMETIRAGRIREDEEYEGVHVTFGVQLGGARVPVQIDIGFGDVITPKAEAVRYPTLLNFPVPELSAYPRETVVAEKFQAMASLGLANSRMKDFFDVWFLSRQFAFEGTLLGRAIQATFARRQTALPTEPPLALTAEFSGDEGKRKQWQHFSRKTNSTGMALNWKTCWPCSGTSSCPLPGRERSERRLRCPGRRRGRGPRPPALISR
jgi:predicted nucleotidyltransferase component of viral defense system